MKKRNLVVDIAKCFNCNCCALACHDEHYDNSFPGYAEKMPRLGARWVDIIQRETGAAPMVEVSYMPVMCNHCDDPPCQKVAEHGAVIKREDGIVLIHPEKALGQKQIVDACPYGVVSWNEEKNLPQAWTFDAHLLDKGWQKTRGSQVCPTEAMVTLHVEDEEMQRIVQRDGLQVLQPELGHRPRVYYKNLDRMSSVFVGGTVFSKVGGIEECIEGIEMVLEGGDKPLKAVTDAYGDFKFAGLKADGKGRTLRVNSTKYSAAALNIDLNDSIYLGAIALQGA